MAIYDLVLTGDAEAILTRALESAIGRGVKVRLAYNQDHPRRRGGSAPLRAAGQSPSALPLRSAELSPPPQHEEVLGAPSIRNLPGLEHRPIPGVPDLMHHKYVVVDGASLWTGSTNWTTDSWTREENVIVTLRSEAIAGAFERNFKELWENSVVAASGHETPTWQTLDDGTPIRAFFTPGRAQKMVSEICQRVATAATRVRICSPVITSGPLLGTLSDLIDRGPQVDIRGVFDLTQMEEARWQWRQNSHASWKLAAVDKVIAAIPFRAKHSTPWAQGSVHDYMHAKCVVCDDTVFVGSYNLSHSGEMNAENVLEIRNRVLADMFAGYVDRVGALYPPAQFS